MTSTPASPPILVTGSHRSGTTWTGELLCASGEALAIHEPFSPVVWTSWLRQPPTLWFEYVSDDEAAERFGADVARLVRLQPPVRSLLGRASRPRSYARVAAEAARAAAARAVGRRALLKDPIAFFSAEWLASTFGMQVVVLIRHPAGFASSLKRLNWTFDFGNLTAQPRLMARLGPFADEIYEAAERPGDVIDQAVLLWRIFTTEARRYRRDHPDWSVARYEDLASDPAVGFASLYRSLGLAWSDTVARTIHDYTGTQNVAEVAANHRGGVRRDSQVAMSSWTRRLDTEEIRRVRVGTEEAAEGLYDADDWSAPARVGGS